MDRNSNIVDYCVLIPLYMNDNPEWFRYSLDSIINQTVPPKEIVIVCDGPISEELSSVLSDTKKIKKISFKIMYLKKNVGLGKALAYGINECSYNYIARMDADDYSVPCRCEKQLQYLSEHPDVDVVGCNVDEFIGSIDNVVSRVRLPETQDEIVKYAKKRCPIRHPALLYKKNKVLQAGNYEDFRHAQDYDLIVNMILCGAHIYNIQETLVYMRVSPDFYKRRGGIKQAKLILRLKKSFLIKGFYSPMDFIISGIGNALICMMPNTIRKLFYTFILRK